MKIRIESRTNVLGRDTRVTRDELVALLDDAIANLPEESRSTALFEIEEEDQYDDRPCHSLHLYSSRLETDEEEERRKKAHKYTEERREAQQRAEYERLKAKFGDK
jgi:hypothetical protein